MKNANEYTLGNLYELAYRAYSGISFDPEKRGEYIIKEYSQQLDEDLKAVPEDEAARYKENYIKYLSAWLSAKGRCLSSMITGPARFPTARNEKANRAESNKYDEFQTWRDKALKSIAKRAEAAKPQAQKDNERFAQIRKKIISHAATIIAIDNGTERGYSRALFVSGIVNPIKTLAKNGETELVARALELLREINEKAAKPVIAAKNSVWQLEQQAEAARELAVDKETQESEEKDFAGGKIIYNYQADRLQILFNEKPDEQTRTTLKRNGYKWAPSAGVWQRQLTENAKHSLRFLNI